jgi:hypothetical protein
VGVGGGVGVNVGVGVAVGGAVSQGHGSVVDSVTTVNVASESPTLHADRLNVSAAPTTAQTA